MSKPETIQETDTRPFSSVRMDLDEETSKRITSFRIRIMTEGNDPTYSFRQAAIDLLRIGLQTEKII